jgi:hypothetical protein
MRNSLNALSKKRMQMQNPLLKRFQGASDDMRRKMMESYERNRLLREEEMYGEASENENKLMGVEQRKAELEKRTEIGKTAAYLRGKGYNRIQAQALAVAFAEKMAELKKTLVEQVGDAKTKVVLKEVTGALLQKFSDSQYMNYLIREMKSLNKSFSSRVFDEEVLGPILQNHGINL